MAEPTYKRRTMKSATNVAALPHEPLPLEWGGYIIRPTDEKHQSFAGFPNAPGVYALYTSVGDLMYVGRSVAIATRLRQHDGTAFWGGKPSLYSFRLVPLGFIAAVECAHIQALAPPENQFMEVGGHAAMRRPMISAIERIWREALPAQRERLDAAYTVIAEQIAARL